MHDIMWCIFTIERDMIGDSTQCSELQKTRKTRQSEEQLQELTKA